MTPEEFETKQEQELLSHLDTQFSGCTAGDLTRVLLVLPALIKRRKYPLNTQTKAN